MKNLKNKLVSAFQKLARTPDSPLDTEQAYWKAKAIASLFCR